MNDYAYDISRTSVRHTGSLLAMSSIPKPSIILAGAWIFFIIFFLIVFIRDRVLSKREMKRLNVSKRGGKYKTRLDILYEILKENKKIKIKIIAKAFEVSNDKAMEWCKILESGHLASIEYPGFMGDPEIRLIGSPMKDKEMKK